MFANFSRVIARVRKKSSGFLPRRLSDVLLGGVVIVAGRNGVAIHFERGEEFEHLLDFLHVGLLIDGGVGGDLVAQELGHANGLDAFLEHSLAFNDEVVGVFEAIDMDVPIEPLGGPMVGRPSGFALANGLGILFRNQLLGSATGQRRFQRWASRCGRDAP